VCVRSDPVVAGSAIVTVSPLSTPFFRSVYVTLFPAGGAAPIVITQFLNVPATDHDVVSPSSSVAPQKLAC